MRVTLIGVRERDGQCVTLLFLSGRVVIQKLPEVYLPASGNALQRQETYVWDFHHILLLTNIPLHAGVAACEAVLISQAAEKPPSGVPLFSWNLAICFQPAVCNGNEITQHRITRWLSIREVVLALVIFPGVFLDSLKAVASNTGNFP